MITIYIVLILADFIDKLNYIIMFLSLIGVPIFGILAFVSNDASMVGEDNIVYKSKDKIVKYFKCFLIGIIISWVLLLIIPRANTLYLMLGLDYGVDLINKTNASEITNKALLLLEKKLDVELENINKEK